MEKSIYFDEKRNILYESDGLTASRFFTGKGWYCSKCLKFYFTPWHLRKHIARCSPLFEQNGIFLITKSSDERILRIVEVLGRMSKHVQGIDFFMTSVDTIKLMNKKVLLYIEDKKPIGIITFCKRKFKNSEKWSVEDFFVLQYMRKKGIGTILFDKMLKILQIDKNDNKKIIEGIVFSKPSQDFHAFLKKRGINKYFIW